MKTATHEWLVPLTLGVWTLIAFVAGLYHLGTGTAIGALCDIGIAIFLVGFSWSLVLDPDHQKKRIAMFWSIVGGCLLAGAISILFNKRIIIGADLRGGIILMLLFALGMYLSIWGTRVLKKARPN